MAKNYNIIEYLEDKSFQFRIKGSDEINIKDCPFCGQSKWDHVYINESTGLGHCKKCSHGFNYNQFRKAQGDKPVKGITRDTLDKPKKEKVKLDIKMIGGLEKKLWGGGEASFFLDYLKGRGLSEKTIKRFNLGFTGKNISIPIVGGGELYTIRYRTDPRVKEMARYITETGGENALFNSDCLAKKPKEALLCEGEFDAMMLVQHGFENTVSTTGGASFFPKSYKDHFEGIDTIYIVYDNDSAGNDGAKKVAEELGYARCKRILLPKVGDKTDVTDFFIRDGGTKKDFLELKKSAKTMRSSEEEEVVHISEFLDPLKEQIKGEIGGVSTGYPTIDEEIGGLRPGRLIVLSGLSSVGKTSLAVCISLQLAKRKTPIFFFSLEMPPVDIAKKMLMIEQKVTNEDFDKASKDEKVFDEIVKKMEIFDKKEEEGVEVETMPIQVYKGSGVAEYKKLEECFRIAVEEKGCRLIIIDHLHYFAGSTSNVTAETAQVVRNIKSLAVDFNVTVILLAHLNRGGAERKKKAMYIPSMTDLKNSSGIEQDADQVLFVCRDSQSSDPKIRKEAFLKVSKNRDGKVGALIPLSFHEEYTWFEEPSGEVNMDYGSGEKAFVLPDDLSF